MIKNQKRDLECGGVWVLLFRVHRRRRRNLHHYFDRFFHFNFILNLFFSFQHQNAVFLIQISKIFNNLIKMEKKVMDVFKQNKYLCDDYPQANVYIRSSFCAVLPSISKFKISFVLRFCIIFHYFSSSFNYFSSYFD